MKMLETRQKWQFAKKSGSGSKSSRRRHQNCRKTTKKTPTPFGRRRKKKKTKAERNFVRYKSLASFGKQFACIINSPYVVLDHFPPPHVPPVFLLSTPPASHFPKRRRLLLLILLWSFFILCNFLNIHHSKKAINFQPPPLNP